MTCNTQTSTNTYQGRTLEAATGDQLTPRQAEAVTLVAEGKTYPETAQIMGCTERTVRAHVYCAMGKADSHSICQLIARLFVLGVLRSVKKPITALLCLCITLSAVTPLDQQVYRLRGGARTLVRITRPAINHGGA